MIKGQDIYLVLEKGAVFKGVGFGDFSKPRGGEFVFSTAMSGMEESLTDPSFAGQILVSTLSHVGNTGVNFEDMESSKIWTEGLICRHAEHQPEHWRSKKSLSDWLVGEGRFLVEGIDTRALTTRLREEGSQRGAIFQKTESFAAIDASNWVKTHVRDMSGLDLTEVVSAKKAYELSPVLSPAAIAKDFGYWPLGEALKEKSNVTLAVWDFGVKKNSLRMLQALGAKVHVFPATAKAEDLQHKNFDAILLSNGPGDPSAATHILQELKLLLGKKKIFAICLGHQLVALAAGAKTYKMKFGHRGIHHPVLQINKEGASVRTWITSQNHGFAVDRESLPKGLRVSFEHADDHSVEGLSLPELMCETVQFHPEAAPGPTDSSVLLQEFISGLK